jgi:UDP-glucose 4-epimerase
MKSIVIGGLGFIGSAIVDRLVKCNFDVKIIDSKESDDKGNVKVVKCDIMDPERLAEEFEGYEDVYNLAGKLGTSELDDQIIDAVNVNVIGALNVFNAAAKSGVRTVFYPSKPNVWLNTYTITKYASEQFAQLYNKKHLDDSKNFPMRIVSLRLFNAYGPRQHVGPIRKIVPDFAMRALLGKPIEIFGSGEQTVDMIYVKDIAGIAVHFTRNRYIDFVDCGRGVAVTVNEVAKLIKKYYRSNSDIVHVPMRNGETPDTKLVADLTGLKKYGAFSFADYEDSMAETLEYYRELYLQENFNRINKF